MNEQERPSRYRSQHEAAWAAWFEAAGIPFAWEPVTFRNGGARYTPDFSLWNDAVFVEVKAGGNLLLNHWMELVHAGNEFTAPYTGRPLLLLQGLPPAPRCIFLFTPGQRGFQRFSSMAAALAAVRPQENE